jgi:hypothetical protein
MTRRRGARPVLIAVVVAVGLAVSGCGGGSAALAAASPSSGATTGSPSPTPSATPIPSPAAKTLDARSPTSVIALAKGYSLRRSAPIESAFRKGFEKDRSAQDLAENSAARQLVKAGHVVGVVLVLRNPERTDAQGVRNGNAGSVAGAKKQGAKPVVTRLEGHPVVRARASNGAETWSMVTPSWFVFVGAPSSVTAEDAATKILRGLASDF